MKEGIIEVRLQRVSPLIFELPILVKRAYTHVFHSLDHSKLRAIVKV